MCTCLAPQLEALSKATRQDSPPDTPHFSAAAVCCSAYSPVKSAANFCESVSSSTLPCVSAKDEHLSLLLHPLLQDAILETPASQYPGIRGKCARLSIGSSACVGKPQRLTAVHTCALQLHLSCPVHPRTLKALRGHAHQKPPAIHLETKFASHWAAQHAPHRC